MTPPPRIGLIGCMENCRNALECPPERRQSLAMSQSRNDGSALVEELHICCQARPLIPPPPHSLPSSSPLETKEHQHRSRLSFLQVRITPAVVTPKPIQLLHIAIIHRHQYGSRKRCAGLSPGRSSARRHGPARGHVMHACSVQSRSRSHFFYL